MSVQSRPSFPLHKIMFGLLFFIAAYMTTITVHAQETITTGDAIQLKTNNEAVITGSVVSADGNVVIINSAGREMKVDLDKVGLKAPAQSLFQQGMAVTVQGKMDGEDFGVPLVKATSITASDGPTTTSIYPVPAR